MIELLSHLSWTGLVLAFGVALTILGIVACAWVGFVGRARATRTDLIRLGIAELPAATFYKLLAFAAFVVLPAGAAFVANYHVFEGSKTVAACSSCHVMQPMVTDMTDPQSETLAARHFKNRWIAIDQCETCHGDYGFAGSMEAKLTGYRHLARYVSATYHEPIEFRGQYRNDNCLKCHRGTPKFERVPSHTTAWDQLSTNAVPCLNCHGNAHPTAAQRTPGSASYERLMAGRR